MSETVPGFLEDDNRTLSLEQRARNLLHTYQHSIPNLVARGIALDSAIQEIHATVMHGQSSAAGLEGTTVRLGRQGIDAAQVPLPAGKFRDRSTTELLGYVTSIKGYASSKEDGLFTLHITCPSEERVPALMAGTAAKFEEMHGRIESQDDVIRLSAWASQLSFFIHPFYDGNGRASRAIFTYALGRCEQPPIVLENERTDSASRALPFLLNTGLNMLWKLYARHSDALPLYIPMTRNPVTVQDVLGLPNYASEEEMKAQKQRSLEELLKAHLEMVDMSVVRALFIDSDVAQYRANAQS